VAHRPRSGRASKTAHRLTCFFQPIVDMAEATILGYEALGRLRGREGEGYAPVRDWAAAAGLALPDVEGYLLRLALMRGRQRPPGTLLFVNLDRRLAEVAADWVARDGWNLDGIVLEVAETEGDGSAWEALIPRLRAAGAVIALDDYGAGVEDLIRLVRLRPDYVKLAGAVARRVGADPYADRVVESLVHQARFSGFRLVVEQIEDVAVLPRLVQLGVRYVQGFAVGRPARGFARTVSALRSPTPGRPVPRQPEVPLVEAVGLTADDLCRVRAAQELVGRAVEDATDDLPGWVASTPASATITRFSDYPTHLRQVRAHLRRLLRGHVDRTDAEAAAQSAVRHLGLDVGLAWYVLAHLRVATRLRNSLEQAGRSDLAGAVDKLLAMDLASFVDHYVAELQHDEVTGLLGRRAFVARTAEYLRQGSPADGPWVLVLLSVESLEALGRAEGHSAVDDLLRHVGRVLAPFARPDRLVGRVGPNLFALVLPDRDVSLLDQLVRGLGSLLAPAYPAVRIRWGVSRAGKDGRTFEALFRSADADLTDGSWSSTDGAAHR
jgi:EAL domain-containing protein (putative c-di-GMP-specific phosphodiesterase class I)/GGDEF domain-containing protein